MKNDVCTSQGELKQEISDIKEELKNGICAVWSSQSKFKERITCMLDTQLKSVTTQVEQQAQELWDDFNKELQVIQEKIEVTWQDVLETIRSDLEATRQDFRDPAGSGGCLNGAHWKRKHRD
jgi:hypothetical protein